MDDQWQMRWHKFQYCTLQPKLRFVFLLFYSTFLDEMRVALVLAGFWLARGLANSRFRARVRSDLSQ